MVNRFAILALSWILVGCNVTSNDSGNDNSGSEPLVVSLTPAIDAVDQPLDSTVQVQFNVAMDTSTITTNSFTITPEVTGALSFSSDKKTVIFTPEAPLTAGVTYTVQLSAAIKDADGNTLTAKSFSFTTDSWQGVIQAGVTGVETRATTTAVDADGNIWVAGNTAGNLAGETNSGNIDIFVAKYSPLGSLLTTKLIGGTGDSFVEDMQFDSAGSLYLLGSTSGDINGETVTGSTDSLLMKYNSSLELQWTNLLGVSGASTVGVRLTLSAGGIPYILGTTTGSLGAVLAGTQDLFYAKVVIDGFNDVVLKKQTGAASGTLYAGGIVVDGSNIFITGSTNVSLDSQTQLGDRDGFITKLDGDLNKVSNSTVQFGATGLSVDPYQLLSDRDGHLVSVGLIGGAGTFESQTVNLHESTFLTQYDTALSFRGAAVYSELNEYSGSVDAAIDTNGNFYVTGYTNSALDDNTSSGMKDAFAIKFSPLFQKQWVSQVGQSTGHTDGLAISVDASGHSYVVGDTSAVLSGSAATGTKDYFVAKFNALGVLQ
ncbi:Ig-like domain-containing protein [Reinekea sp. G2M2-21]|uniref:Ig-like domain-containing protein n=1 Tax=Reinekea sp. G2M2-21 TaxID=2788942 RepID=UPI0018A90956|nr:Ig-like domain-containing protein [Reinekea sp. G2M2-21]